MKHSKMNALILRHPYNNWLNYYGALFSGQRDEGDTSLGRLPTDLSPIHYVLELQPDIYKGEPPFFFNGSVSIRFGCQVATSVVYLNSKGLNIDGSSLNITTAPDSPVTAPDPGLVKYEEDNVLQFLKVFNKIILTYINICYQKRILLKLFGHKLRR